MDWLGNILEQAMGSLGQKVSTSIFDSLVKWLYETVYNALADFFTTMGNMGAEVFELDSAPSVMAYYPLTAGINQ